MHIEMIMRQQSWHPRSTDFNNITKHCDGKYKERVKMNKEEIVEEIKSQPWLNVLQVVAIITVGQIMGFGALWYFIRG